METEDTARVYRQDGAISVFTPSVLEDVSSYLADDPEELLETVVDELHLLQRHWRGMGNPLLVIPIRDAALQQHRDVILKLARQLGSGVIESIPVRLGCLSELVDQAQEVQLPPLQPPTDNGTTEGGRYGDYRQAGEAFNQLECAIVGPLAAEEQGGEERRRAADGFPRAAYINEPSAASSRSGAADEQTRMLC